MKKSLLLFGFVLQTFLVLGQEKNLTTLTTAGGFDKGEDGISVSWTIGEVFSATVQDEFHVTAGFQQGNLKSNGSIHLTAQRIDDNYVQLDWKKQGVIDTDNFIVQKRDEDSKYFVTISNVKNNIKKGKYTYMDENSSENITYYRILFKNNSKEEQKSNFAQVEGVPSNVVINTFPNPTTNYLNIEVDGTEGTFTCRIWSVDGRQVFEKEYQVTNYEMITINEIENYSAGQYILEITNNDNIRTTKRFIKAK